MQENGEIIELVKKSRALYACVMRYSTEMIPLRDRAVDSAVLGALLDSNEKKPLKIGQIQSILQFGSYAPELRLEIIRDSLNRLVLANKIRPIEVLKKQAYYIEESTGETLSHRVRPIEDLLTSVIKRHMQNFDGPLEKASAICQIFLSECFARLGNHIAQSVVKGLALDDLAGHTEVENAFQKASSGQSLAEGARISLRIRCMNILKSTHPEDVQLKFYLTNCYYVAQLLGMEPKQFDPLAEQAFSGSVFYLDTNVLILGLLSSGSTTQNFEELVRITRRLDIELRVTRATINETRRAAASRIDAIKSLAGMVPDEILERTGDNFVESFLLAREQNPAISPDDVFLAFHHISEIIPAWGLTIEDKIEEEMIAGRDFASEVEIIQEVAIARRARRKTPLLLNHDLAHLALIEDQRKQNPKTWFLTRDGILTQAANNLAGERPASCFSLFGFLQSISPFLTTPSEKHSFADVFAKLLTEQILPTEPFYDINELLLLAEKNRDVLATPKDRLIPALEYAKTVILKGRPYTQAEVPEVALGLATFLTKDADLREKELIRTAERAVEETMRIKEEAEKSKQLEREAVIEAQEKSKENEKLKAEIKQLTDWVEESKRVSIRRLKRRRNWLRAIGILSGLCLWGLRDYLWKTVGGRRNLPVSVWQHITTTGVGVLGLVLICLS